MGTRQLKLRGVQCLDTFKLALLRALNLLDAKKPCVDEFEKRLGDYLARNPKQVLTVALHVPDIEARIERALRPQAPFPTGYELGNPHNRWPAHLHSQAPGELERRNRRAQLALQQLQEGVSAIVGASKGQLDVRYTQHRSFCTSVRSG